MAKFEPLYAGLLDPAVLQAEERIAAESVATSSNTALFALENLSVDPTRLRGRRVVDLGSGTSDIVRTLCEQGVDAVGVDVIYEDPEQLHTKSTRFLGLVDDLYEASGPQIEPGASPFDRAILAKRIGGGDPATLQRETHERFVEDFGAHPERYIAGSAAAIPLPDRSTDLVINHHFLSNADTLPTFMAACVLEMVRILGKNGSARIGPYIRSLGEGRGVQYDDREKIEIMAASLKLLDGTGVKARLARRKLDAELTVLEIIRQK